MQKNNHSAHFLRIFVPFRRFGQSGVSGGKRKSSQSQSLFERTPFFPTLPFAKLLLRTDEFFFFPFFPLLCPNTTGQIRGTGFNFTQSTEQSNTFPLISEQILIQIRRITKPLEIKASVSNGLKYERKYFYPPRGNYGNFGGIPFIFMWEGEFGEKKRSLVNKRNRGKRAVTAGRRGRKWGSIKQMLQRTRKGGLFSFTGNCRS